MEAYLSSTAFALMKLLARRGTSLNDGRQSIWPVLGLPYVMLSLLIMLILMMIRVEELSLIIFGMESETLRLTLDLPLIAVQLSSETCTSMLTLSFFISFGLTISLISYLIILLLRRIRQYYTEAKVRQRRRWSSGYWSRRRIYWRRRGISRTEYISEAIQFSIKHRIYCKPESHRRKEVMLSNSCSDILKRNSHAVTRTELVDELQDINDVMKQKKKQKGSSDGAKRSLKKRGRSYKKEFSFMVETRRKRGKKKIRCRRRTGGQTKSSTVDSNRVFKRASSQRRKKRMGSICPVSAYSTFSRSRETVT